MNTHYDRDTLVDYLHGALEPASDAAVFAHVQGCAACRAARDEEAEIGESLRAFARKDERELPSMVKARVWEAVREARPTFAERLRSRWGPAIAVPLAAVVALAAYLGTPIVRDRGVAPGVAASFYLDEHNAEATQNPLGPGIVPGSAAADTSATTAASYIDTADAATLDSADGALR